MLCDDGAIVVGFILKKLDQGVKILPTEISLKHLETKTGVRPQNIGMAFDPYISVPLAKKGIEARKCGTPRRIQLRKVDD